jgi:hypothetical protein
MRIALILSGNVFMSPFVNTYIRLLEQYNIKYDIIFWDRLGVGEEGISYRKTSPADASYIKKIIDYIIYIYFVKKNILSGKYDKLVVFGIALSFMLSQFLKTQYRNKYIIDIRDDSVIRIFFGWRYKKVLKTAALTVISSNGFLQWLPKKFKYVINHNCVTKSNRVICMNEKDSKQIVIANIGSIRDYKENADLLSVFANDWRIIIRYIGEGVAVSKLKKYAIQKNIKNIEFIGKYEKKDEQDLLQGVTIINGLTGSDKNSKTLLSNRLYLSVQNRVPIIVSNGSYQAQIVEKYGLGLAVNVLSDYKDYVLNYIKNYDRLQYIRNCEKFEEIVEHDQLNFEEKVKEIFYEKQI